MEEPFLAASLELLGHGGETTVDTEIDQRSEDTFP